MRRLEQEKHELLELLSQKQQQADIPLDKIQLVCRATIHEFKELVTQFENHRLIFEEHALAGLEAIVQLEDPMRDREVVPFEKKMKQKKAPSVNYGKKAKK